MSRLTLTRSDQTVFRNAPCPKLSIFNADGERLDPWYSIAYCEALRQPWNAEARRLVAALPLEEWTAALIGCPPEAAKRLILHARQIGDEQADTHCGCQPVPDPAMPPAPPAALMAEAYRLATDITREATLAVVDVLRQHLPLSEAHDLATRVEGLIRSHLLAEGATKAAGKGQPVGDGCGC